MDAEARRPQQLATRLTVRLAGALSIGVGLAVLAGWALDQPALKSVLPGWVSVKPNTALGFVLVGLAILALDPRAGAGGAAELRAPLTSRLLASLAGLLGLTTLGE